MTIKSNFRRFVAWLNWLVPDFARGPLLCTLLVQVFVYWGAGFLTAAAPHYCLSLPQDGVIPLMPWTVVIYYGSFAFWSLNYLLAVRSSPQATRRFVSADIRGKLIAFLFFIFLPTTARRPVIENGGQFNRVMRLLYALDTPTMLFPSLHCYDSWMCVIGIREDPSIPRWYKAFSLAAAFLICLSTLTTKQHVLLDVPAGLALAQLSFRSGCAAEQRLREVPTPPTIN